MICYKRNYVLLGQLSNAVRYYRGVISVLLG